MDDEYQRQIWRWCRDQEILERQKEVCELRDRLRIARESFRGTHYMEEGMERSIDAALSRTEPVAGRWVSKEVADRHVTAALDALQRTLAERDAAIARAEKAEAGRRNDRESLMRDMDRVGADVADAIRARDEVGIQLAAAQAEIARLRKVADEARAKVRTITEHYKPGWVDGLKAVARSAGYDPDKLRHEGVDPPTFIEDVILGLRADLAKAQEKAAIYEKDWREAKSEFGADIAKLKADIAQERLKWEATRRSLLQTRDIAVKSRDEVYDLLRSLGWESHLLQETAVEFIKRLLSSNTVDRR